MNESENKKIRILESQIRECFARVVWANKIHEKTSDIYINQLKSLKILEIILSACITTSLLISIFGDHKIGVIIAAILSTIILVITIYTKDNNLSQLSQNHAKIAIELWNIRESYFSLIVDIQLNNLTIEQIIKKRDELQNLLYKIYQTSPRTNDKAYKLASQSLNKSHKFCQGEEMTFSDEEIDRFLPSHLRRELT